MKRGRSLQTINPNKMLSGIIVVLTIIVILLLIPSQRLQAVPGNPSFGTVTAGTYAQATVHLWNISAVKLKINSVYPGCGCTTVSSAKSAPFELGPFSHFDVTCKVDTASRVGPFNETLFVATTDARNAYAFRVSGNIVAVRH